MRWSLETQGVRGVGEGVSKFVVGGGRREKATGESADSWHEEGSGRHGSNSESHEKAGGRSKGWKLRRR